MLSSSICCNICCDICRDEQHAHGSRADALQYTDRLLWQQEAQNNCPALTVSLNLRPLHAYLARCIRLSGEKHTHRMAERWPFSTVTGCCGKGRPGSTVTNGTDIPPASDPSATRMASLCVMWHKHNTRFVHDFVLGGSLLKEVQTPATCCDVAR